MPRNKPEQRLRKLFTKWTKTLGLEDWDIHCELAPEAGNVDRNLEAAAETITWWQYMRATVRFCKSYVEGVGDAELEHIVIHELMHVVLAEMEARNVKHEERAAVMLQRAFSKLAA